MVRDEETFSPDTARGTGRRGDVRPCCLLREMFARDAAGTLGRRFGSKGLIPHRLLRPAMEHLAEIVEDLEPSPNGPSTRNDFVRSLVRRVCMEPLGRMSDHIAAAIRNNHSVTVRELIRAAAGEDSEIDNAAILKLSPPGVFSEGGKEVVPHVVSSL